MKGRTQLGAKLNISTCQKLPPWLETSSGGRVVDKKRAFLCLSKEARPWTPLKKRTLEVALYEQDSISFEEAELVN